jgi:serpin B
MRPLRCSWAFLALTLACNTDTGRIDPETQSSEKLQEKSPQVDAADQKAFNRANTDFSFALYQQLRATESNIFYSPHSVSAALAMTYAGAAGSTADQMAAAMHFELPEEKLNTAFNWLEQKLAHRNRLPPGEPGKGFALRVANALWSQTGLPFEIPFLDTLAVNYGTGLHLLDFAASPEASHLTINAWVEKRTEGKIKNLIPPRAITPLTRLVLTNVIYFLASWEHPFKTESTTKEPFHLSKGTTVDVPMMKQTRHLAYAETIGWQAVEMPYNGRQLSMVLFLPMKGELETFESDFSGKTFRAALGQLRSTRVELRMPRFALEASVNLKKALQAMGMVEAFTRGAADFTKMSALGDLYISAVLHKGYVKVDEEGTEAAAATAMIALGTSTLLPPKIMTLNRAFLFVILDKPTGAVLFVGRVVDPTA